MIIRKVYWTWNSVFIMRGRAESAPHVYVHAWLTSQQTENQLLSRPADRFSPVLMMLQNIVAFRAIGVSHLLQNGSQLGQL